MKHAGFMKNIAVLCFASLSILLYPGCNINLDFGYEVIPVYDTIRSYPGGGGIFTFKLDCPTYVGYKFNLSLTADEKLHAELSKNTVSLDDPVFEVIIKPDKNCEMKDYSIKVSAKVKRSPNSNESGTSDVTVQMYNWDLSKETAYSKMCEFKNYLVDFNPDYKEIFDISHFAYATYPEILIVEHSTWLSDNYEVRLCYHVMIPPDDWSKIRIRKRNEINAELALTRDSAGNISILDIYDYPTFIGY